MYFPISFIRIIKYEGNKFFFEFEVRLSESKLIIIHYIEFSFDSIFKIVYRIISPFDFIKDINYEFTLFVE